MLSLFGIPVSALVFLALYIKDKDAFLTPLSRERENECAMLMAAGDKAARNELIEHNLRLVAHIAKRFSTSPMQTEELISIGTVGLIKAADSFRYERSLRFSTYASKCITNEMLMHFRNSRKYANDISLFDPVETESGSVMILDTLASDFDLEHSVELQAEIKKLYAALTELGERDAAVIVGRYGLDGHAPRTQAQLAKQLHISRSYVSRIEKSAIEQLRKNMSK